MPARAFPAIIALGVLLFIAATSLFTVSEAELAIRTEFGAIVGLNYAPGLHGKWPWDQVVKFDRRIISQTYAGETFLTNDNRGLVVDFYIKWRVQDPSTYFQAISVGAFTKALGLTALWPNIAALAVIAVLYFSVSVVLLKKQEA